MELPDRAALRQAFGDHIRTLRQNRGVSQEQLGDLAGLHRTYVGSVERGERNPTLETMVALSTALGVPVSELLAFEIESP